MIPDLNPVTVFVREKSGRFETNTENIQRGRPLEGRDRDWRCIYKPRAAINHRKLGERHGTDSSSEPPEGTNPAGQSDLGILSSRTMRE